VSLRSFWHHSHVSLTNTSTAGVCYYPKDMGAMTSLSLANSNIGTIVLSDGWQYDTDANEYWREVDGEEQVSKDVPEGCLWATWCYCRCQCHQGHGGDDEPESCSALPLWY
jgi:hypothetical protein